MPIIAPIMIDASKICQKEGWPGAGVSPVSFDPDLTSLDAPALWLHSACNAVVVLERAPAGFAGAAPIDLIGTPVAVHSVDGRRHIVVDAAHARHRFWLPEGDLSAQFLILLPLIGGAAEAAAADARRYLATGRAASNLAFQPSDFQRQRLVRLLAILDAVRGGASNREIGTGLVYPRLAGIAAQAWKASSERRHTQRLIAEAEAMASSGYRRLLTDQPMGLT